MKRLTSVVSRAVSGPKTSSSVSVPPTAPILARGQFSDILRDIEKQSQKKWKAVYIFGLASGANVRIGTTSDPKDLKATGQSWHAEEVVLHALVWCESTVQAEMIVKELKKDLHSNLIRGTWYDILPDACLMAVDFVARRCCIPTFSPDERRRALEASTYRVMNKAHPELMKNIVPINRRVI